MWGEKIKKYVSRIKVISCSCFEFLSGCMFVLTLGFLLLIALLLRQVTRSRLKECWLWPFREDEIPITISLKESGLQIDKNSPRSVTIFVNPQLLFFSNIWWWESNIPEMAIINILSTLTYLVTWLINKAIRIRRKPKVSTKFLIALSSCSLLLSVCKFQPIQHFCYLTPTAKKKKKKIVSWIFVLILHWLILNCSPAVIG